ncbi:MAG: exodeoxyribonuclease V subunit beta [Piscirickettsiaceae bacterium]|nr:exodeoxyribonuclease V subunit beta [Piscirickettsiaceae bacterium]
MSKFDAGTVLLKGLNLIEASAGTGKTYTLAELYLRLLLEPNEAGESLTVDQILVVTYTRAATEELRERLRQKLVDARDDLLKAPDERDNLKTLIEPEEIRLTSHKLMRAIQSFDEAAIFTIHGFCQRVLGDFAFESGLRFELELIGDDQALLQSMTDDFWRREVTLADKDFVAYLVSKRESPEGLLKSIRNLVGKPYIQCMPVPEMDASRYAELAESQFEHVKRHWKKEQDHVIGTLRNKALLNGNKYRQASVEKWLIALMLMLESTMPARLSDGFEKFTQGILEGALKKGQTLPELNFWSACELLLEQHTFLKKAQELQHQRLRLSLLQYLQKNVPEQKMQQQVQSYDDLLLNLEHALNSDRGDWLVAEIRQQYQAALIDEFQDTDPIQYASFSRIYADSGLPTFLVGDPKQAIYSFRGADIFTYLKAKSRAENEYTLMTNWRSHPNLVTAVNALFENKSEPFIYQDIPFHSVGAARDDNATLIVDEGSADPLQFMWADSSTKPHTKKELSTITATVTADEIARLLNLAEQNKAVLIDDKTKQAHAVTGGDIAVLVRNHRQGSAIQQALQERGVNSVRQGTDNVFNSDESQMLVRLLSAIAEPNNEARVTSALATNLWGLNAQELYELQQDATRWHAQLDVFVTLHQIWQQHGFMRVFRELMTTISAQQRLLSLPNGERQLTNLLHLSELIQEQCRHQNEGIEAVLNWLTRHIESIDPNDESAQLRLESDEQLVKIITIHKSKGLEYPIVFCPFLWDVNLRSEKNDVLTFHDGDDENNACATFAEPMISEVAASITLEERAEDLRLLYVALTRARERCVIVWGAAKYQTGQHVSDSALFSLLHPNLSEVQNEEMKQDLMVLAERHPISVTIITEQNTVQYQVNNQQKHCLAEREFNGDIQVPWRISSFSALAHGYDAELPDYDAQANQIPTVVSVTKGLDRFSFPRGAQAGTCLHALFEVWDFSSQDLQAMEELVEKTLLQYGFDEKWTAVACQWMNEVLATPLNQSGLTLGQLHTAQRLDELEFYFPINNLSVNRLQQQLLPLLAEDSPLARVIERLRFTTISGFMKGFIDLVFEHQGRFYVVDYKSNHLGNTEGNYQSDWLADAMVAHDYPLQYLIYSLALHRYLRLRLPDYDPEQHLGGVYYLFIRGMHPDWNRAGIFYDKPDIELLDQLDRCLQGTS